MARFIGILSAKGGVGKTTTSINLGIALTKYGKRVVIVDGNLTTPNVGVSLGVASVPVHLHHVLAGKKKIKDAVYQHESGALVVPASISVHDIGEINPSRLKRCLTPLKRMADIVIIDGAAGLGAEATAAIKASDEIIVVTNPDILAVADALKAIKFAEKFGKETIGVIVTRTKGDKVELKPKEIERLLEKPVLGVVPEDKCVKKALSKRNPVISTHPNSSSAIAYKKLAANILGENYKPESFIEFVKDYFKLI